MAYMNQERKAKIKANLDAALKGTGVKFSLRCDSLSIFIKYQKVSNRIPLVTNKLILIGTRIITPAKPKS